VTAAAIGTAVVRAAAALVAVNTAQNTVSGLIHVPELGLPDGVFLVVVIRAAVDLAACLALFVWAPALGRIVDRTPAAGPEVLPRACAVVVAAGCLRGFATSSARIVLAALPSTAGVVARGPSLARPVVEAVLYAAIAAVLLVGRDRVGPAVARWARRCAIAPTPQERGLP
jgi:hypothetical protein